MTIQEFKADFQEKCSPHFSHDEIQSFWQWFKENLESLSHSIEIETEYKKWLSELMSGKPIQYIFGYSFFHKYCFEVTSDTLIPRPETEELVDWVVADLKQKQVEKILDLCTGSGCIALALKSQFSKAKIHAVDYSSDALELAKENSVRLQLDITMIELDVLKDLSDNNFDLDSYDVWISNPPYIPVNEKTLMHSNVLDFEPEMALFVADDQALIFYQVIAEKALRYLKTGGHLYFELNENYTEETFKLITDLGFEAVELKLDLQGKKRMLKAIKKGN